MEEMLMLSSQSPLSLLVKFGIMGWNDSCAENCSGHGECHNGTCLCEIQFDGKDCHVPNLSYFVAFATVFFLLAFVCLVQLVMCIVAEWQRMKAPSFLRACRITTQKLLYFVVFLAAVIRGAYFTSPTAFEEGWSSSLMSAYYPLVLSGASLIVCFWAEVFHLRDISWERPQFLSKSFLGFVTFNIINYSLLLAEFITTQFTHPTSEQKNFYTNLFNGCYAFLLFIVVIFFLIYGVEVFFKRGVLARYNTLNNDEANAKTQPVESFELRAGFLSGEQVTTIAASSRTPAGERGDGPASTRLVDADADGNTSTSADTDADADARLSAASSPSLPLQQKVDISQLHQSRIGLLSQALMLSIVVGFLFSETLSELWKKKVPLVSRNWHDIVFRVVEIGVALWFPCVLWNCMSPEQLWILNPKRILKKLEAEQQLSSQPGCRLETPPKPDGESVSGQDCWICYDTDRRDAGPLIQPCDCRGDVSTVHHDCLRRWLVESSVNSDSLKCKVCGAAYQVERGSRLDWQHGFTTKHWLQTAATVTCMCLSAAGAWVTIQLFEDSAIRMLAAGAALLVQYACVRFLGLNTVVAYQRAKVSALNIMGGHVSTISETVAVDIPNRDRERQQASI
ncbi:uncharacterized protein LOC126416704 isoform X1 [Schistocerca serialis cubense]|uniref:uncharacterized protein LOC126416704 isoform X1 n=1 Tax=Schistocerca serialis cubense TaxID=2023355 RepID=UPI00214EA747|nr:uncharacterized protein LOC126416704 isoform X1 [Schistocerca serialis cubense]XP_049940471.1 uncharacterized protein LOC126416704 isoform X1 [Schistocerca serialis cubense]XP_049940472.1 uncharacterized protein LOC126416704 isoform X1 [Schistocerca serialis cubense]